LQKERIKLLSIDLVTLVEYIQTSIEILMNLKSEEVAFRTERDSKLKTENKAIGGASSVLMIPETADDQSS
jgi:hypothetical protein